MGTRLGRYELREVVGRGGMGVVYQAVLHGPAGFRKDVALKVIKPNLLDEPSADHSPLVREARLGAMLSHPNLVSTLELGRDGHQWFVAMELVRGASIRDLARAHHLPPSAVLDVGVQACAALAHVHELRVEGAPAGLVHRDVKPGNLLLDQSGLVKLADLGIARLSQDRDADAAGTAGFMPPEQMDGEAEARSDLFALGVVLYILATRKRPFGSGTRGVAGTLRVEQSLSRADFLAPVDQHVSGLAEVLHRCLRFEPEDRWSSAVELGRALRTLQARQAPGVPLTSLLARARPDLSLRSGFTDDSGSVESEAPTLKLPLSATDRADVVRRPTDSFIGRDDKQRDITTLLQTSRLLTLVGPGGIGKTRLALEVASQRGPAVFCDLSLARDLESACVAVAQGLQVAPHPTDPTSHLGAVLASRGSLLLVLDNLEQVPGPAARLVQRWLDLAPALRVIATSRTPLRIASETILQVGPLSTEAAVALFESRSPVAVTDRDSVRSLVQELDHLPLAIELAAARARLMGPKALLKRLSDRFRLLTATRRDRPDRHATLRATIEASWELLHPWEQSALAQLSVMAGGFALEIAERIVDVTPWPEAPWAVDVVEALVDHSLVRFEPATERFSLYRSVAAFASEQLDGTPGARRAAERRHGELFARRGRSDALRALRHHGTAADRRTLVEEVPELMVAAQRALARADTDVAVDAACGALNALSSSGPLVAAAAFATEIIDGSGDHDRLSTLLVLRAGIRADLGDREGARADYVRARQVARDDTRRVEALLEQGALEAAVGDSAAAAPLVQQGLQEAVALGDAELEASARKNLGIYHRHVGDHDAAAAELLHAIQLLRPLGSFDLVANLYNTLGNVHRVRGDTEQARRAYERALQWNQDSRRHAEEALVLGNLATLDAERGRIESGLQRIRQVLELSTRTGNVRQEQTAYATLGILKSDQGQYEESLEAYERALALAEAVGEVNTKGTLLANIALLHLGHGHLDQAEDTVQRALEITRAAKYRRFEGYSLCTLGMLRHAQGRGPEAEEAFEQSRSILEQVGDRRAVAAVQSELAVLVLQQGDAARAASLLTTSEVVLREVDDHIELAKTLATRAEVDEALGRHDDARARLSEAMALQRGAGLRDHTEVGKRVTHARAALAD